MKMENEWIKVGSMALYVVIVVLYAMAFSHPKLKWLLAVILLVLLVQILQTIGTKLAAKTDKRITHN